MIRFICLSLLCVALVLPAAQAQTAPNGQSDTQTSGQTGEERRPKRKKTKKPEYDPNIKGHPYFGTGQWAAGALWYDGALLPAIPLRYDLVKDEVVLRDEDPDNPHHRLRLLREKVDSFTVAGRTFVRLPEGSTGKAARKAGFYERLHQGPVSVWAKREKYISTEQTYQRVQPTFQSEDRFYLRKDGKLHLIKGEAGLLKALADRKQDLQDFIRKENLELQDNLAEEVVRVVRHYDQLVASSR